MASVPAKTARDRTMAAAEMKARVLLVDDHPENLIALEALLGDLGVSLERATSGPEALKHLLDDEYALVLLDIQMPLMDGYETASLIRQRVKTRNTPIIFVTAIYKSDENVRQGFAVGATDYITKPLDGDVLKAKVASFVNMAHNTKQLESEIVRRKAAEENHRKLSAQLERRVLERTVKLEAEIAERRAAEEEINALNTRLQRAMTETHHRIKNNLQVIAAMVDLQVMQDNPEVPVEQVMRLGTHVKTLALVHDLLTEQAKKDGAATHAPAGAMLRTLFNLIKVTSPGRPIHVDIEDVLLASRQCTSLALLTSEIVANALKHGDGDVHISFSVLGGEVTLAVCDEGPGFGPDFDPKSIDTTGLNLVSSLSQWDLNGHVEYSNTSEGARVVLRFPKDPQHNQLPGPAMA